MAANSSSETESRSRSSGKGEAGSGKRCGADGIGGQTGTEEHPVLALAEGTAQQAVAALGSRRAVPVAQQGRCFGGAVGCQLQTAVDQGPFDRFDDHPFHLGQRVEESVAQQVEGGLLRSLALNQPDIGYGFAEPVSQKILITLLFLLAEGVADGYDPTDRCAGFVRADHPVGEQGLADPGVVFGAECDLSQLSEVAGQFGSDPEIVVEGAEHEQQQRNGSDECTDEESFHVRTGNR